MDSFIKILEITIWPLLIAFILLLFRRAILNLISRIQALEAGGNKIVFNDLMNKLLPSLPNDEDTNGKSVDSVTWKNSLIKIAELSPRAAMIEAWTAIELACIEAGMTQGATIIRFHPSMLVDFLNEKNGFSKEMISRIMEMRKIRNVVIHGREQDFEMIDSKKYIELADKVLSAIKELPSKRGAP